MNTRRLAVSVVARNGSCRRQRWLPALAATSQSTAGKTLYLYQGHPLPQHLQFFPPFLLRSPLLNPYEVIADGGGKLALTGG